MLDTGALLGDDVDDEIVARVDVALAGRHERVLDERHHLLAARLHRQALGECEATLKLLRSNLFFIFAKTIIDKLRSL